MKKTFVTLCLAILVSGLFAQFPYPASKMVDRTLVFHRYVRIKTAYGECIIQLYEKTPLLRDNFIKLAKAGFYNGLLFHRLSSEFVIQGGDPQSKSAKPGELLGMNSGGSSIPFVPNDSLFHKRGAIAMASSDSRDSCNGSQFYIVQGKRFTDAQLDSVEVKRLGGVKIATWKRDGYKTLGGLPHLDPLLPVFGEVVMGMDMVDRVAMLPADVYDRPLTDVPMEVSLLNKRECRRLDRLLQTRK